MKTIAPPLSNAVTYILLALAERDLHGYGIMQETTRLSGGEYKIGPGLLYDNLRALMAATLVEESEVEDGGEARRIYHLTQAGAAVLDDELKRLAEVVKAGRSRLAAGQTTGRTREV
ncbi:transcriptional regulator, PadR family [Granulicella rosea]|uniref:Transcriptional regulator, PadR family n=1 Tax=Granulicella rosea TaxID=474952 RepID=A0A239M879_9BACT|nr:PadR family transcriptional regulator [Granulicella rosea]SNT38049.1 transcriptional regulator, PadR family [Granulicella rosea]